MARRGLAAALVALLCGCAWWNPHPYAGRMDEWRHQAESLRGLQFQHDVAVRWIDRDEFPAILREDAADLLDPVESAHTRDGYAALGLLPPDIDLPDELVKLTAREAAGIYSTRKRTLYVVDSESDPNEPDAITPVVVHELVHALQDQSYTQPMQLMTLLRNQDDVATALSALLEGDASLTMFGAMPGTPRSLHAAELARVLLYREAARPESELVLAPRFLAVSLVFPYADGTVLAARHYEAAGNAGLDRALREPPLSSRQVLFPDDPAPVEFVRLPLDGLVAKLAPAQCTVGSENTVGANALRVLFETEPSSAAIDPLAGAWRGDRFAQLECGREWELVWVSRWRDPGAAAQFAERYRGLAPAIAAKTPLSGPAEVTVDGRTVLVSTPRVNAQRRWLLATSEVRAYGAFADWLADGCFPDSACPSAAAE